MHTDTWKYIHRQEVNIIPSIDPCLTPYGHPVTRLFLAFPSPTGVDCLMQYHSPFSTLPVRLR